MDDTLYDRLRTAADRLAETTGAPTHDVVVVLGSGLGGYGDRHPGARSVPYADLPGFPVPHAVGHAGTAVSVTMGDNRVLLYSGRAHAYEGHPLDVVTFPVRAAILHGCRTVVLSNAAGGCGEGLRPGDLVNLSDHINLSGLSPLRGPNDDRLGPRFPDLTHTYDPALRALAREVAASVDVELKEGVYAWFQGPMFETPAEVRMAEKLGADLVGMSTVPEAVAARHMGADVVAVSLCTNLAAGIADHPLSSEEVIEEGAAAADRFARLLDALLPRLPRASDDG